MTSYPDFICIGAQKAATTWLYEVLRRTPGVFLPAIKELHYFSEQYCEDAKRFGPEHRAQQIANIRAYHRRKLALTPYDTSIQAQLDALEDGEICDDWYRALFAFAGDHEICGEICPCYMSMPVRGVRHAMSINPLLRVLVLVRDPVDRAWSHIRMHAKSGLHNSNTDDLLSGQASLGPYLRYTDYANSLERWKSFAGSGRFKAVLYDEIQSNPQSTIDEIVSFIGAPSDSGSMRKLDEVVFSGKKADFPVELRARLLDELAPQYAYLHTMFPEQVERWTEKHKLALCTHCS